MRWLNGQKNRQRAQIWATDLIFASGLLIFVLLIFFISWNDLAIKWNSAEAYRELKISALYAADSLLTTQGEPKSWETLNLTSSINQIKSIGLVDKRSELNNEKLASLLLYENSSYAEIKDRLGLSKYEINIQIIDNIKNITYYDFGMTIPQNNKETAVIKRPALLNGSIKIFKLTAWSE